MNKGKMSIGKVGNMFYSFANVYSAACNRTNATLEVRV